MDAPLVVAISIVVVGVFRHQNSFAGHTTLKYVILIKLIFVQVHAFL